MESAEPHHGHVASQAGDKGLKKDAIGFWDALVVGISSTAPAYSLAAVIGIVVVGVGLQAPGVLLVSFIPMFLIAAAFYYMNRADPDCGTNFSWITRAIGPSVGWVAGFAVCTTGLIVIGSLADVAAYYMFDIVGWESALPTFEEGEPVSERIPTTILATVIIIAVTAICVIGTELSARTSRIMIGAQVGALLLFAVVALVKVFGGDGPDGSIDPSLSWLWPWEVSTFDALVLGLLTGVFIYWGWESAVNLNEETEDSDSAPGQAAVVSTVLLLLTYLLVTYAVIAWAGVERRDRVRGRHRDPRHRRRGRARLAARLPRDPGDHHVGHRVGPDHDPAGVADPALDGAPGGDARGVRQGPPALPDAARRDDRRGRGRRGLVRVLQPHVPELPVRLAHRAGDRDRLLLLAHRVRLRDLPPQGAHEVGEELLLHRRGAGHRGDRSSAPCSSRPSGSSRASRTPTPARRSSAPASRWCSAWA